MTARQAPGSHNLLQERYEHAAATLRQALLDGQPWEALEPVRRQVTELEIALDHDDAPRRPLRLRRLPGPTP
ncbi:MAG: hypothetical protein EOO11_04750 [Chitinophagaceae bacterium]|nr:MAG: hypothetical protein EOO11_04750 [Chitinophagaceae bacterium]